ncbi:hypothetical protein [Photobacterium sp. Hal280]|uniref:hypothetical protein n=1 Tax=Photobacterium sp. Hal280 TaxID=3035163 RepID=UPI00301BFDB3
MISKSSCSQAKGRVERANKTLQDHLIKEMRLQGNKEDYRAVNVWLPGFITNFNRRFAKLARFPKDMHRPLRQSTDELNDIFTRQELCKLSYRVLEPLA